jgi:N-hydroxyarylamine O-acetyltransferase
MTNFSDYFKKLNIELTEPSLELVKALQKKHIATFSFNNIAVLLGKPISLNIEDIFEKIVTKNLGGYCFEHNALMYEVLKSLGFNVRILVAKVLNNQDVDSPRTHRITLLEWKNEQYIVDVGFGSATPPVVLKLNNKEEEGYKIVPLANGMYHFELLKGDEPFIFYRFDLTEYTESDCVMGNFYSSQHPNAVFVNNFVISLIFPKVTLSFRNGIYHRICQNGTEIIEVKSVEQLQLIVNDEFFIPLGMEECTLLHIISNK